MKVRRSSSPAKRSAWRTTRGGTSSQGLAARLATAQASGRLLLRIPPAGDKPVAARRSRHRKRVSRRATEPAVAPGAFLRSDEMARLEAALYLAREPLSVRRLAKLARLPDGTRARVLLKELQRLAVESGSAFRVEQIAGGFQLLTRGPFGPWIRRLLAAAPENRLSNAAMETLAVVAYRQPVTRAEIEAIRGVGCEEMLRQLLDRDFVAIGGRVEELGRPNVYITTRWFLQAFGLARIEDLPHLETIALAATASDPAAVSKPKLD
jgi:segregation and condensation protein B